MGEQELTLSKIWTVEYGRSFFKSDCQGCGLRTRKQVYHVFADYYDQDGDYIRKDNSSRFVRLKSNWHSWCHDQLCRHDFCVKQRKFRRIDLFGVHIADAVKAFRDMIKTEDVPKFLSSPHPELNGLSPLHMIWEHDEWGLNKVIGVLEGAVSGSQV